MRGVSINDKCGATRAILHPTMRPSGCGRSQEQSAQCKAHASVSRDASSLRSSMALAWHACAHSVTRAQACTRRLGQWGLKTGHAYTPVFRAGGANHRQHFADAASWPSAPLRRRCAHCRRSLRRRRPCDASAPAPAWPLRCRGPCAAKRFCAAAALLRRSRPCAAVAPAPRRRSCGTVAPELPSLLRRRRRRPCATVAPAPPSPLRLRRRPCAATPLLRRHGAPAPAPSPLSHRRPCAAPAPTSPLRCSGAAVAPAPAPRPCAASSPLRHRCVSSPPGSVTRKASRRPACAVASRRSKRKSPAAAESTPPSRSRAAAPGLLARLRSM